MSPHAALDALVTVPGPTDIRSSYRYPRAPGVMTMQALRLLRHLGMATAKAIRRLALRLLLDAAF